MNTLDFTRELIKGRIGEVIFQQMLINQGEYIVIPFGYEHTMPLLRSYRHMHLIPDVMENIADAPDFALISEDKTKVFLFEVKYRTELHISDVKKAAQHLKKRWNLAWLFFATPEGFYASSCNDILESGTIKPLSEAWVPYELQQRYLKLMREFKN